MGWKKFTIKTKDTAEEIITGILAGLDIYSVEIEDSVPLTDAEKAQMFVDIAPERENDHIACVSFYVSDEEDYRGTLIRLKNAIEEYKKREGEPGYTDIGECSVTTSETEDIDWINNWKQFFSGFYIDDIYFVPSWESEGRSEDEIKRELTKSGQRMPSAIIHIDPGIAFGTGKHETTQLCIMELEEQVKEGDAVLDIGTGSGVLSMLAFKFGAGRIFATDIDEAAVDACRDNFERNSLSDKDFKLVIGNIIDDPAVQEAAGYGCYDVVVANILADILIPMTPAAARALKSGGVFITSGIIEGREGDVAEAMREAGLSDIKVKALGEWRMVLGRKTGED